MITSILRPRLPALGLGETRRRWRALLLFSAAYAAVGATIYLAAGLGEWSPSFSPVGRSLALCVGLFFLPSLVEELVWRWLLIPPTRLGTFDRKITGWVIGSTVIFTAAHPVAGLLFVPHVRELFCSPAFLAIVFLLGLTCGATYVVAKSIWPPVVIHWLTVLAWKLLLGGPFVLLGR